MKKNITNFNNKGQWHGYQEWYVYNKIVLRGYRKNDILIGYTEGHNSKQTIYYIN